jgi:MSHA biogenesis protein MshE
LVLSTLHTNDAISSAVRLLDMGVEPYLAASSLRLIIAQRLVRRLCIRCVQPYLPNVQERIWLESILSHEIPEQMSFLKGAGCPDCNNSGYRGRVGVYEMLLIDEAMADALRRNHPLDFANLAKASHDFRTLGQAAFDYASLGITSLDEVFRISGELE